MAQQVAGIKQGLAFGQYLTQTEGKAGSGQGWGSTPYGAQPTPADANNQVKDRTTGETRDTAATDFEGLYAPESLAHGNRDERVHGQIDFSAPPQKVEEIRWVPEDQKALRDYQGIVGAYAEGEEKAMQQEQVPLEYQELVKQYFDELKDDSEAEK
ncbi:hypothetical protein IT575_15665 [bacterium]|nr:hypothetical protein [bacterium]